jgi:cation:H+ antiporter
VIWPLAAARRIIRHEGLLMFGAVVALSLALMNGSLQLWEGIALFVMLVPAIGLMVRWARTPGSVGEALGDAAEVSTAGPGDRGEGAPHVSPERIQSKLGREFVLGLVALIVTIVAAELLVDGVVRVGDRLGWSAAFMGFITGVGTSLPELAAAVAGARQRATDLVLGNILGSNIFNSLGVAGIAGILGPGVLVTITPALVLTMAATVLVAGVFSFSGRRIGRIEGGALLAAFAAYAVLAF